MIFYAPRLVVQIITAHTGLERETYPWVVLGFEFHEQTAIPFRQQYPQPFRISLFGLTHCMSVDRQAITGISVCDTWTH